MLVELVASQFVLESALADVANADPAVRDQLRSQLSNIAGLRQQIGTASGNALGMLRGEVTALASNAAAAAQEARSTASANASSVNSIATLANAARQQTAAVMAGMKDFEPYLRFNSPEDEAEYRRREADRRAHIEVEQAKGTPQGDVNAAHLALEQMKDAGAHGADKSPDYQSRFDALSSATNRLDNAVQQTRPPQSGSGKAAAGAQPTSEVQSPSASLEDAMAALQAAGVQASSGQGHGVQKIAVAGRDTSTSVRV